MYSFNGIGTTLYGKRERQEDGSYIATKWVTVVWVPIIPLGSYRVIRTKRDGIPHVIESSEFNMVKVPLDRRQVRNTYLLWALVIFLYIFLVA